MAQLPSNHPVTYQLQYRTCGKPTCRTCRLGLGHGPYWYAYWREGSRLRSMYIGKDRPASLDPFLDRSTPERTLETLSGLTREEPSPLEGSGDDLGGQLLPEQQLTP